jgi:putative membrane protein
MPNFLITWVLATISLMITAAVVPGVHISSIPAAAVVAIVIGLVNAVVRPILVILTLPLTILSLGLFLLVVNAISLSLASYFSFGGLKITGFWPAIFGAIVLSVVSSLLNKWFNSQAENA